MITDLPPHARLFTLREARQLLPRVRQLMDEALASRQDVETTIRALHQLESSRTRENTLRLAPTLRQIRQEVGEHVHALQALIDAVHNLGCLVKGVAPALVDFPSWHEGRVILLCWKAGDEDITFWHEVGGNFSTREPLP